jgi:hypothetical protein
MDDFNSRTKEQTVLQVERISQGGEVVGHSSTMVPDRYPSYYHALQRERCTICLGLDYNNFFPNHLKRQFN